MEATQKGTRSFRLYPGRMWLDLNADDTVREDNALRECEHARTDRYIVERRLGSRKVHAFTAPNGALTFGTGTRAAWAQPLVPVGGFWNRVSFVADRPASGDSYIVSSTVSGKAYGPLQITLSSAGALKYAIRDEAAETEHSVTVAGVTADATIHLLAVYDPVLGTLTLYIDGESVGSVSGLGSTMQPMQDATTWVFGVNTDGAGTPTAGTEFDGALDAWCFGSLRGTDPSGGSPTLLSELRRWSFCEWRNPASRMVLSCFDFNDVDLPSASMLDRSRFRNNAAITGTPTAGGGIAYSAYNGNFLNRIQLSLGRIDNVVMAGGALFYETIRGGTA